MIDVSRDEITFRVENRQAKLRYDRDQITRDEIDEVHAITREIEDGLQGEVEKRWEDTLQRVSKIDDLDEGLPSAEEIERKINAVEGITEKQREKLQNLFYKYIEIFRKKPGRFKSFQYRLKVSNDNPFYKKSYPIPMQHREKVNTEIQKMLDYDIIERSDTPFINPTIPVIKKDGSARVCMDARELNERLQPDHDGLEEMEQVLKKCENIGVMSSIDLRASFWQVPLHPESRRYCGFMHGGKTYQYKVMPFGLTVSSGSLTRASEPVIRSLLFVVDFVDDWMIISAYFDEHLMHLEILFERILQEGITVNFDKIEIGRKEMKFIGHRITTEGIKLDNEKFEAIQNFEPPRNLKELRSFLGLINFSSKFTDRMAFETAPLSELVKKNKKWEWGAKHKEAFEKTKLLFCQEAFLHYPLRHKPYVLHTDASGVALGAALCQQDGDEQIRIVSMAS